MCVVEGGGEGVSVEEILDEVCTLGFEYVPVFLVEDRWESIGPGGLFGVHAVEGLDNSPH